MDSCNSCDHVCVCEDNMTRDELYMKKALELAEIAAEQGEVPVGAIVV